jgi:hypothetical protein
MVYLSFTESFLCRRQSGLQTGILFRLVEKEKAHIMFNLRIFNGLTDNHAPIFFLPIFKIELIILINYLIYADENSGNPLHVTGLAGCN